MSRQGLKIATERANTLPTFESITDARRILFEFRDASLSDLLSSVGTALDLDFSPPSLLRLERWYFEDAARETTAKERAAVLGIGFYFGEMLCRNASWIWEVTESVFGPGRFEIGISNGQVSFMLTNGMPPQPVANKRMQNLWRTYCRYAS